MELKVRLCRMPIAIKYKPYRMLRYPTQKLYVIVGFGNHNVASSIFNQIRDRLMKP
jgi:hypothetical protein